VTLIFWNNRNKSFRPEETHLYNRGTNTYTLGNKNYKNPGTKVIKISEQKLQKFGNKNLGTKIFKTGNKNCKNIGTKITKNSGTKI
jgi:hypothetical protein